MYNVTVGVEFASKMVNIEPGIDVRLQIWDTVNHILYRQVKSFIRL